MSRWSNHVVLITGASAGIGAALARQMAKEGASVVLTARRKERLETLASELEGLGAKALAVACDVNDLDQVKAAVEQTLETFGKQDVVIANAGFGVSGSFSSLEEEDYRRQFETNVFGVLHTLRASLDALKASKGRFSLVGSVNSYISLPGTSAYGMSKFAVRALGMSLWTELKPHQVSCTLICPGFVESEIRQVNNQGEFREKAKDPIPSWLVMPSEKAARQISKALYKRKNEVVITGHGKFAVFLQRHMPWFVQAVIQRFGIRGSKRPTE